MKISRNTVASVSFTVLDDKNAVVDRTKPDQPVVALIGHGYLVPGLEKALDGHEKGDEFTVTLNPADAYGEFDPNKVQEVNKAMFGDMEVEVGSVFEAEAMDGSPIAVHVTEVKEHTVVVDSNHPYAGKTMTFLVVVDDVREATAEEKEHGHAHADGHCPSEHGHHHCCGHHHCHDHEHEGGEHHCHCHDHEHEGDEHHCHCHDHEHEEGEHHCHCHGHEHGDHEHDHDEH